MFRKLALAVVLLFVFSCAACPGKQSGETEKPGIPSPAPAATTVQPIRLGALLAVTGPANSLGLPEKQTLEMLTEEINAAGGILGRPLELVIYDTEGDETKTVTLAKRLIANDKVTAIIGPTRSGTSMAIVDMVNTAQLPMISLALSYQIVTESTGQQRKWVFKTAASDSASVEKMYDWLVKQGIKKIALMTVSNGYGDSGRAELVRLAPNYGIEIVADERFGDDDVDMTSQLTKVKVSEAQAIVVWATQKAPAIIAKNHKTLGMKTLLVQSQGVATKKFIELCGEAADGQVLPGGRLIVADQLLDSDPQKAVLLEYKQKFEAKYGPVSMFGGHAWDALMLLKMAMEKAGTDDPAKVRDALEQIQGFVGIDGVFNLSAADHCGLSRDAFIMLKIENGDWKIIE